MTHPTSLMEIILHSNLINILLVLGVLSFAFQKFNLAGLMEGARERLVTQFNEVKQRRLLAEQDVHRVRQLDQQVTQQVTQLEQDSRVAADSFESKMQQENQRMQANLLSQYLHRKEQLESRFQRELAQELVSHGVRMAGSRLASELSAKDHAQVLEHSYRLLDEALSSPISAA